MAVLSATMMNSLFQAKSYERLGQNVSAHLASHPLDVTSASKFLNAAAFHLFSNECGSGAIAINLCQMVVSAVQIAARQAANVEVDAMEKIVSNGYIVLLRRFFKDAWWEEAKSLCAAMNKLLVGRREHEQFLESLARALELIEVSSPLHPSVAKHIKAITKEAKLSMELVAVKHLSLKHFFLDVYLALEKILPLEKWPAVEDIVKVLDAAEDLAPDLPKVLDAVISMRERLAVLTGRLAGVFRTDYARAKILGERSREIYLNLSKDTSIKYTPSFKVLGIFHGLNDIYDPNFDNELISKNLTMMSEVLTLVTSSYSGKLPFFLVAYDVYAEFYSFYVEYNALKEKAVEEIERNAKLEEELAAKKSAMEANRLKGDPDSGHEDILSIGDTMPYLTELGLEKQEAMWKRLKRICVLLEQAMPKKWTKSEAVALLAGGTIMSKCLLRIVLSVAEFLGLLGHESDRRKALDLLYKLSQLFGVDEFRNLAVGDKIKMDDGTVCVEQLKGLLPTSTSCPTLHESYHILIGIAYAMYYRGETEQAVNIVRSLLDQVMLSIYGYFVAKISDYWVNTDLVLQVFFVVSIESFESFAFQVSSVPKVHHSRMLSSELNSLLSLCRSAPGAHIIFPAPNDADRSFVEYGLLDFALLAFLDIKMAWYGLGKQAVPNLAWIAVLFRAQRLYYAALETLLRIYRWLKLGRELRCYGKFKLDFAQTSGLPFR